MMKKHDLMLIAFILGILVVPLVSAAHDLPTRITNQTGLMEGWALWAYNVTHGAFWTLLLAGFCVVLFMSASVYETSRAFGFASVTGMLGSIFLVSIGLMPWWIASIFILGGVIGIVIMVMSRP